jgi:hypothetical protein
VVTLSEAPFTVVHVDAAFTRMTGFSCLHVLGQSLFEFTRSEDLLDVIKLCTATLASATLRKEGIKKKSHSKRQKFACCEIRISPVGQSGNSATHLVLDMKPSGDVI